MCWFVVVGFWISNTIDWEYSSNLSLMSISSYVVHSTKETGNIYQFKSAWLIHHINCFFLKHVRSVHSHYKSAICNLRDINKHIHCNKRKNYSHSLKSPLVRYVHIVYKAHLHALARTKNCLLFITFSSEVCFTGY